MTGGSLGLRPHYNRLLANQSKLHDISTMTNFQSGFHILILESLYTKVCLFVNNSSEIINYAYLHYDNRGITRPLLITKSNKCNKP